MRLGFIDSLGTSFIEIEYVPEVPDVPDVPDVPEISIQIENIYVERRQVEFIFLLECCSSRGDEFRLRGFFEIQSKKSKSI